jgi:hypothetical protein
MITRSGGSNQRANAGTNRAQDTAECASNRATIAAAPINHDESEAVAVRPMIAPQATAAAQSNGANSASVRRSVETQRDRGRHKQRDDLDHSVQRPAPVAEQDLTPGVHDDSSFWPEAGPRRSRLGSRESGVPKADQDGGEAGRTD